MTKRRKGQISRDAYGRILHRFKEMGAYPVFVADLIAQARESIVYPDKSFRRYDDISDGFVLRMSRVVKVLDEDEDLDEPHIRSLITRRAICKLGDASMTEIAELVGPPATVQLFSAVYYFKQVVPPDLRVNELAEVAGVDPGDATGIEHATGLRDYVRGFHMAPALMFRKSSTSTPTSFYSMYAEETVEDVDTYYKARKVRPNELAPVEHVIGKPDVQLKVTTPPAPTGGRSVIDCMKAAQAYGDAALREIMAARDVAPPLVKPGLMEVIERTKEFNAYLKRMGGV